MLRLDKKEIEYTEMTQDEVKTNSDIKKMKRRIIGTVSIRNHNSLHESAWIHRLAIEPEYPLTRIGKPLIEAALKHAYEHNMFTCETVSSECHEDYRELLLKMGFMIKQIYHKSIVGSSLRVMKVRFEN
jgi:N-acetylglutamate synthase-like GNAT family acetyltransferase